MYIELMDEEDVRDSMEELIRAKSQHVFDVNHIRVQLCIHMPLRIAPASLGRFFDFIRTHLPETELEIDIMSSQPVDTAKLSRILEQAPNLYLLEMDGLLLGGHDCDVKSLAEALGRQGQLRTIYLQDLEHVDADINLQPLADALCSLPKLETLEVYQVCFSKNSAANTHSLASIARLSKAKCLEIMPCSSRHDIQEQGLAVTEGLLTNQVLEKLCLMTCTSPRRYMFKDPVLASLGRALQSNPLCHLHTLELNVCENISLLPLCQALETNTTLKSLLLCWDAYGIRRDGKNVTAFRRVLRDHNYVLERLDISLKNVNRLAGPEFVNPKEWVDPQLEFYLRLNRMGRRHLLEQRNGHPTATRADWIDVLSECQEDLSSVYYYLSRNPLLCSDAVQVRAASNKKRGVSLSAGDYSSSYIPRKKRHCLSMIQR